MIKIESYSSLKEKEWNEFNQNSKNYLFMFDRKFMEYHKDRFVDSSLMFYDDDKLCALLPLTMDGSNLVSHGGLTYGGFIVDGEMKQHRMNECFLALKDYMKSNGFKNLLYKSIPYIYHSIPCDEEKYSLFINQASVKKIECSTVIDLTKEFKIPKGRKAQIKRAIREGVVVEESEEFENFIDLENEVLAERHNAKAVHTASELRYLKNIYSDNIKLFIAKKNTEIIAASLIFIYDNLIHTQYLAANNEARRLGALDLVISTIIDRYKGSKKYIDFGISTENGGLYLNEGLISQKESFGGRTVVYETFELFL